MRSSVVAMWATGFVVGLAVLSIRPSEPWRDMPVAEVPAPLARRAAASAPGAAPAASPPRLESPYPSATTTMSDPPPIPAAARSAEPLADSLPSAVTARAPAPNEASLVPDDGRLDRLVAAKFERERAAALLRREAELRRAAFYAEYEASGTLRPFGSAAGLAGADQLRAELGDDEYERYLEALGQPTRVVVGMVDGDSPAAHAGLLPDDEIVAYAGQRVFNARELNVLMLEGAPGEIVPATIVRDGHSVQIYVTRGPLGIVQRP